MKKKNKYKKNMSKLKQFSLQVNASKLNEELEQTNRPESTTLLVDEPDINDKFLFYDESKKEHHCKLLMVTKLHKLLKKESGLHCYWCRNSFQSHPIGCPIHWVNSKVNKKYYSNITNDTYQITGELDPNQISDAFEKISDPYYIVDGIFCSMNCCLAYILDNNNPMYENSEQLLYKMLKEIIPTYTHPIKPSPHWKTLAEYGGTYTIREFREQLDNITIEDMSNINIRACCPVVKEILKF